MLKLRLFYSIFCNKSVQYFYPCSNDIKNFVSSFDNKINLFEVLGIKKSFSISENLVDKYKTLQARYHPDKYSLKSQEEQEKATEYSSLINKAYTVLKNPVSRGEYMLKLAGHPLQENEMTLDSEFLLEIMGINEKIAEASTPHTVQEISITNKAIMEKLLKEAEVSFSRNDIEKAREVLSKLKYYENINEKVKCFEIKHGIVR